MILTKIMYKNIDKSDFAAVISLGTKVHGEGYIDEEKLLDWVDKGIKDNLNASYVAYDNNELVGFRLTFSVNQWQLDQWCSPSLWKIDETRVCYFKCNTVDERYRGCGIGSELLKRSRKTAQQQGAIAGVSHLWMQSPGNSAVKYFKKCGGFLIKEHADRWHSLSLQGYQCPVCEKACHCSAAEMLIHFKVC